MAGPRRIAYGVSRFPTATETFVVREMNAVEDGYDDLEIQSLMALFPASEPFLHPGAKRWMERLHRPSSTEGAAAMFWWMGRRPLRLTGAIVRVVAEGWRAPRFLLRSLATLPLAAAHARRMHGDPPDHVHVHFASYPALSAWLIRRLTGIPYSFTAHAYDIFKDQSLLAMKVAEADFVVAISEFNRRFLADYGGDVVTPVHVVHCGIDPAAYRFRARPIPAEGPVRAACVAAMEEKKGHAVLLDALAQGGPELDRLGIDLVGDGPLRAQLEARAAELGLADRLRFHGRLEEARVGEILDESVLFILPSIIAPDGQMEGLPVALMEALASGLMAVSTQISGIPEIVRDGETGYLAKPGDPASLAAALTRAITGAPLDPAVGRELVEAEFDIKETAAGMHRLLASPVED
jgi:colanic acid/amylovoran biosynthesis glycosyltransferase